MNKKREDSRNDEELMRSYQEGDYSSFEILYARHSSRVYGFLFSRLKSRSSADDVFQGVFLKLHQARHHYNPSFPFLPWLFTVAKSAMLDTVRKESQRREDANDEAIQSAISPTPRPEIDLSSLQGAQKEALALRYKNDLPFEEIARRLETTPSNIRQLISRGIRKLRSEGGTK